MTVKVPFVDLTRIHAPLKAEILARIGTIIDQSAFVLGPDVEAFEKQFADFLGMPHVVGVASGLDALKLALLALGIAPGDEVITSANTFIATAYAISATGAKPVLVDAEEDSFNLDPRKLEKAITKNTKAVIPVHLYGQAASMKQILEIARAHGLKVVEDTAQALGTQYQDRLCGTLGDIGCFSFYPGKNLGAMGEGGAICTRSEEYRDRMRMLRNVGQKEKYNHECIGHNSRLHTIQAAVLSAKLPALRAHNETRVEAAKLYGRLLGEVKGIKTPEVASERTHVYHLYVIATGRPEERDALQQELAARGIQTGIHYPIPIHLSRCYANLGYGVGSFPVTERLAKSILSLPIFPGITSEEIKMVVTGIKEFYKC